VVVRPMKLSMRSARDLVRGRRALALFSCAAAIAAGGATSVTQTSAMLNGAVALNNLDTAYQFQYGTTTAYGQTTHTVPIGQASGVVTVSATIRNLTPGTTYHFRLVAAQGS
jgi:hypothetical protein